MFILRFFGWFYFRILRGWRLTGDIPPGLGSCVIVNAPHTANDDYILGLAAFWMRGHQPSFVIKKEAFKGLAGVLLRWMDAIPVDRRSPKNFTQQLVEQVQAKPGRQVVFTPEGTRKLPEHWKTGFYRVAVEAGVPLVFTFTDHGRKNGGFGPVYWPTGDPDIDFPMIHRYYRSNAFEGKYPEQASFFLVQPPKKPAGEPEDAAAGNTEN